MLHGNLYKTNANIQTLISQLPQKKTVFPHCYIKTERLVPKDQTSSNPQLGRGFRKAQLLYRHFNVLQIFIILEKRLATLRTCVGTFKKIIIIILILLKALSRSRIVSQSLFPVSTTILNQATVHDKIQTPVKQS